MNVPVWDASKCLQCNMCSYVCPHAVIRPFLLDDEEASKAPNGFQMVDAKGGKALEGLKYSIQVAALDCTGCGETPYAKLITQLFGDRMYVATATGCSQLWATSFPSFPYTTNPKGQGPAVGGSLFENNAEGSRITGKVFKAVVEAHRPSDDKRDVIRVIKENFDHLTKKSVWFFGGDGWVYDIGYGKAALEVGYWQLYRYNSTLRRFSSSARRPKLKHVTRSIRRWYQRKSISPSHRRGNFFHRRRVKSEQFYRKTVGFAGRKRRDR